MLQIYNFKIIKSGKEIEVYEYKTKDMLRGYKRRKRVKIKPRELVKKIQFEQDEIEQLDMYKYGKEVKVENEKRNEKAESSIRRTKANIKRLANANPQFDRSGKFRQLVYSVIP